MEAAASSCAIRTRRRGIVPSLGKMKAPQKEMREDAHASSASDGEGSTHSESSLSSIGGSGGSHIDSFMGIHIISELNLPESPITVQSPNRTKGSREPRVPLDPSRFNLSLNLPEDNCIKEEDEERPEEETRFPKEPNGQSVTLNGFVTENLPLRRNLCS